MNKVTLRIPTKDQYAFVEIVIENVANEFDPKNLKEIYDKAISTFNSNGGVSETEFNNFLISWVNRDLAKVGDVNFYEKLSQNQKDVVQSLKRYYKRIESVIKEQ